MRAAALALLMFAVAACGKYGPPVRSAPEPAAAPVSSAPTGADTEECPDPNAPPESTGTRP